MSVQLIKEFEKKYMSKNKVNFNIGDTIRVHTKIIEGEKERIQIFTGIVIAIKGKGLSQTFSVYRSAYGCSMERVFLIHSPRVTKIEIQRKGKVRKSKLYYLRGESGKKAKVKEQLFKKEREKALVEQLGTEAVEEEVKAPVEEKKEEAKEKAKEPKKEEKPKAKKKTPEKKPKEEKKPKKEDEKEE
ncbi:MAG: 50S ribosomal protein L19 [Candidatus Anoxychlamydiales bacterium]|nr:50S ribosomal protein L19 [Candidatus Anoxychlamydiales bacterium]